MPVFFILNNFSKKAGTDPAVVIDIAAYLKRKIIRQPCGKSATPGGFARVLR
jgi:hypothetical protein